MTRTEQIEALLRSLFDYLPGPKTAHMGDVPGATATLEKVPCQACGGNGTFGKRKRKCEVCKGDGTILVDPYTRKPLGTERAPTVRAADPRRIDAELARLARDESIRRGRLLDDPFEWEANRQRYRRAGSYAALERALEALRGNEPDLHSLTMRVLVYGTVPRTEQMQPHLERAIAFLAKRMPPEIKVPKWVTAEPVQVERQWPAGGGTKRNAAVSRERNATIIALRQEGMKQADIAERVGVSQRTVSSVLKGIDLAGTVAA